MKRSAKPTVPQLNLPLIDVPAATVPGDKQRELAAALMELLISAALESSKQREDGGVHEPEVDR